MELDYTDGLTKNTIDRLEEAARAIGLPLRELELIGQDPTVAEAFVEHVGRGEHAAFLDDVDWRQLEGHLHGRARLGSRAPKPASA